MRSAGRWALLALVTTAALAAPASSASATTFDGQCMIHARINWDPPLKLVPEERNWWFDSQEGSNCTGTLDGEPFNGDVIAHAQGVGTFACDAADARGARAYVEFEVPGANPRIDYTVDAVGALRVVPMRLTGDDGGSAGGYTQFWTTYHLTGVTSCLPDATGVPSAHFDALIATAPGGISG